MIYPIVVQREERMSLIRGTKEEVRKGRGKQPPDIDTEVAIARYEYSIASKPKPPVREEDEEETSRLSAV